MSEGVRFVPGDRASLARAITLVESARAEDRLHAEELLASVAGKSGNAFRIGITGVPGAGKSTFIDALGMIAIEQGHKVAVLTVDPSSPISGGSILGDKTRMSRLCAETNAFVRPSPSRGHLGGIAQRTREAMLLCEAAGFDLVIVETVGTGQSETAVRHITDFFLLLALAGAGDELQGIKRGVLELVDAVAVNKADAGNEGNAAKTQQQYVSALQLLRGGTVPPVVVTSAITGVGLTDVWAAMQPGRSSTAFAAKRAEQAVAYMRAFASSELVRRFEGDDAVSLQRLALEQEVRAGRLDPAAAASRLLSEFKL